jgi:hypothetical protein
VNIQAAPSSSNQALEKASETNKKVKYPMKIFTTKYIAPALLLGALALPATAQTPPPPPFHHHAGVNARLHEQQERIHQGVGSDQLTRREQYRLDVRDARIRTQEGRDRLSGGKFTPA